MLRVSITWLVRSAFLSFRTVICSMFVWNSGLIKEASAIFVNYKTATFTGFFSVVVILLSVLSSINVSFSGARAIYFIFTGELLCLFAALTIKSRKAVLILLLMHIVAALMVSIYAITTFYWSGIEVVEQIFSAQNPLLNKFSGSTFEYTGRAISTVGNPNILGAYLVAAVHSSQLSSFPAEVEFCK